MTNLELVGRLIDTKAWLWRMEKKYNFLKDLPTRKAGYVFYNVPNLCTDTVPNKINYAICHFFSSISPCAWSWLSFQSKWLKAGYGNLDLSMKLDVKLIDLKWLGFKFINFRCGLNIFNLKSFVDLSNLNP